MKRIHLHLLYFHRRLAHPDFHICFWTASHWLSTSETPKSHEANKCSHWAALSGHGLLDCETSADAGAVPEPDRQRPVNDAIEVHALKIYLLDERYVNVFAQE